MRQQDKIIIMLVVFSLLLGTILILDHHNDSLMTFCNENGYNNYERVRLDCALGCDGWKCTNHINEADRYVYQSGSYYEFSDKRMLCLVC